MTKTERKSFEKDSKKWRGKILTGRYAHRCWDWDGLPVDETTTEFLACGCYDGQPGILKLKKHLKEIYKLHEQIEKFLNTK
jgi:hypothetical protein